MISDDNFSKLSLYRLFYIVCECGSFSQAARALNITQPSVSYNIKKLEEELGVVLFERGNNLQMTPEAKELYPYVKEAINSLKNGEQRINEMVNMNMGQIKIGVPAHIGVFLLTNLIKKFNNQFPNIKFQIICKSTKELVNLLNLNEIDVLIDSSPLEEKLDDVIIKKIAVEKCAMACNITQTELINKPISLSEVVKYPIIVPLKTSSSTKSLYRVFERNNILFDPAFEIATSDMIADMVEKNIGIGFLFEKTIAKYPLLKKIDLNCKFPEFDIFLLYKESLLSVSAQEFVRFINKETYK